MVWLPHLKIMLSCLMILYHFKNHHRVPEIIVVADVGYTITGTERIEVNQISPGTHGYDNQANEMRAFFLHMVRTSNQE